jgi:branched-subunit amino acid permease
MSVLSGFRRVPLSSFRSVATCGVNEFLIPCSAQIAQSTSMYQSTIATLTKSSPSLRCSSVELISNIQVPVLSNIYRAVYDLVESVSLSLTTNDNSSASDTIWLSSTIKKRRMKMNKHKLKKRKKSLKMNTKVSRA